MQNGGQNSQGFIFRVTPTGEPSELNLHYEVFVKANGTTVNWEYYNDDSYQNTPDTCEIASTGIGDYFGATIAGTGDSTVVTIYRPDSPVDQEDPGEWGAAACTMTGNPANAVDTGTSVGVRDYTDQDENDGLLDDVCIGSIP